MVGLAQPQLVGAAERGRELDRRAARALDAQAHLRDRAVQGVVLAAAGIGVDERDGLLQRRGDRDPDRRGRAADRGLQRARAGVDARARAGARARRAGAASRRARPRRSRPTAWSRRRPARGRARRRATRRALPRSRRRAARPSARRARSPSCGRPCRASRRPRCGARRPRSQPVNDGVRQRALELGARQRRPVHPRRGRWRSAGCRSPARGPTPPAPLASARPMKRAVADGRGESRVATGRGESRRGHRRAADRRPPSDSAGGDGAASDCLTACGGPASASQTVHHSAPVGASPGRWCDVWRIQAPRGGAPGSTAGAR